VVHLWIFTIRDDWWWLFFRQPKRARRAALRISSVLCEKTPPVNQKVKLRQDAFLVLRRMFAAGGAADAHCSHMLEE
jgi:hypothetical protein